MGRKAVIDIGTNSVRLLICDVRDYTLTIIYKGLESTRLGAGVDTKGELSAGAMDRTLRSVKRFKDKAVLAGADDILAIATSAVRDARNGRDFVDMVGGLGLAIQVLGGEQEAELGFLGALLGTGSFEGDMLLVDIGGGSTELVLGNATKIENAASLDIGAVRLTERYAKSNPIAPGEIMSIRDDIDGRLDRFGRGIKAGKATMVGIGGTISSLAAIDRGLEEYDTNLINGYVLPKSSVEGILYRLAGMSLEERRNIPGLQSGRADIIVAGAVILNCVMDFYSADGIIVSDWDNLEGAVYKRFVLSHKNPCG